MACQPDVGDATWSTEELQRNAWYLWMVIQPQVAAVTADARMVRLGQPFVCRGTAS